MAIAVKLKGEDELAGAPLLLKQNQNRQILRGYESLNDQQQSKGQHNSDLDNVVHQLSKVDTDQMQKQFLSHKET